MHGKKVGVAQLEVVDLSIVSPMEAQLLSAMRTLKNDGYHSILMMLTDTMKEGTKLLVVLMTSRSLSPHSGIERAWQFRVAARCFEPQRAGYPRIIEGFRSYLKTRKAEGGRRSPVTHSRNGDQGNKCVTCQNPGHKANRQSKMLFK